MRHETKEIRSISELIGKLDAHCTPGEVLWFRGQEQASWKLVPSIARDCEAPVDREWAQMKAFRQNAARFVEDRGISEWEWLFLMQHYGVPTRLLDWTESPLIALYFAVASDKHADEDGALWVIAPTAFNAENGLGGALPNELPFCDLDDELDGYRTSKARTSSAPQLPIAAIASRGSSRIAAQLGAFTIFHSDFTALEEQNAGQHIWKYRVPAAVKAQIKKELNVLRVTQLSLFPELANAGAHAKEAVK